jgi:outer membrane protein OmpA-like peptidoglycan-associated protein
MGNGRAFVLFVFCSLFVFVGVVEPARANVVGSDIQNFNPTTSGLDFVTVQSSETLSPGIFNFGYFLNYAVNTMPNFDATNASRTNFEDYLLGGDINFGLGLMENWDFGVSFPQVYSQNTEDRAGIFSGEISQTGLTEIRLNSKYRFFGDEKGGLAAIVTVNFNRIEDNPFTGIDAGPTWNVEAAYDWTASDWVYGLNAGYRMRDPGRQITSIPIEPFRDAMTFSGAASRYLPKWDLKLIGEIFSSFPTQTTENGSDRNSSVIELLLGGKKDLKHNLALHFGAGTELYQGSSSADWRVYSGLNWNMGPLWSKKKLEAPAPEQTRELTPEVKYAGSEPSKSSEKFSVGDVLFASGSDQIGPVFAEVLKDLAQYLKTAPFKNLTVEGHTDSVGSEEYNQGLSERRAKNVVKFLAGQGISQSQLSSAGFGESRPVADNSNYQGRAKNRRVEFNVTR